MIGSRIAWRQIDQYRWTGRAGGGGNDGTGRHATSFWVTQNHDKYGPKDGWSWSVRDPDGGGNCLSQGVTDNRIDAQKAAEAAYWQS